MKISVRGTLRQQVSGCEVEAVSSLGLEGSYGLRGTDEA
jgi:hypothetical protein